MADEIAEVFITIRPRTTGFKQEAEAELEKSKPEVKAKVSPEIDKARLAALKAEMHDIGRGLNEVKIGVNDKAGRAVLEGMRAELAKFGKRIDTAKIDVYGEQQIIAGLARTTAHLAKFSKLRAVASIDGDDKPFNAAAARVKLRMANLDHETITPEIKLESRRFYEGVAEAEAALTALGSQVDSIDIGANDKQAAATIARFKHQINQATRGVHEGRLGVEDGGATATIKRLEAEIDAFGHKHATATLDVNDKASNKVRGATGILQKLIQAAIAVAPALVPIGATAIGVSGQLLTSLAPVTAGFGAFGIAVAGAKKIITNDLKAIQKSQLAVQQAQTNYDQAKGPKQRATALEKLKIAQENYKKTLDSMAPSEREVVKDTNKAVIAFTAWERSAGLPAIAKVAHAGLPLLNTLLKIMTPLVNATADAFVILEKRADKSLHGAFGQKFIAFLTGHAKNDILVWARALANIGKGFAGILLAFAPFDKQFGRGLDNLTKKFADWGASLGGSQGFKNFFSFFQKSAPVVGKLFSAVARAFADISRALKGIGLVELKLIVDDLTNLTKLAEKDPAILNLALAILAVTKGIRALKLLGLAAIITPLLSFANAHPAFAKVATAVALIAISMGKIKTAIEGISIAKLLLLAGGGGGGGVPIPIPGGGKGGGAAGGVGKGLIGAGEGVAAGGIGARIAQLIKGSGPGRAVTGLSGLFGEGAIGAAGLGSALGLVVGPLILSFLNKNFTQQGSHLLDNKGTTTVTNRSGDKIEVPIPPHPSRGASPAAIAAYKKALRDAANSSTISGPPLLPLGPNTDPRDKGHAAKGLGALSGTVLIKPHFDKPLEQHGGKVTLPKNGVYIPPANLGIHLTNGQGKVVKTAKDIVGKALDGIGSLFSGGGGKGIAPPPNLPTPSQQRKVTIKVAEQGAAAVKKALDGLFGSTQKIPKIKTTHLSESGSGVVRAAVSALNGLFGKTPKIKTTHMSQSGAAAVREAVSVVNSFFGKTPKIKTTKMSQSGAKIVSDAVAGLNGLFGKTPKIKTTHMTQQGAKIVHDAVSGLNSLFGKTPDKKNTKVSTTGAKAAHDAIGAIKEVLGLTPNKKDIKHSTPGSKAAHDAIAAIKLVLGQTPNSKNIKHATPGSKAAHDAIAAIKLVLGQTPNKKTVTTSAPGAKGAHNDILSVKDAMQRIPKTVSSTLKVIGTASEVFNNVFGKGFARGGALPHYAGGGSHVMSHPGYVQGPGSGTSDDVLYAPAGIPRAKVSNTEYINRASAVSREGVWAFDALNRGDATIVPLRGGGSLPHFADGGSTARVNTSAPGVLGIPGKLKHGYANFAAKYGKDVNDNIQNQLNKLFASGGGGGGGGNWIPVIATALKLLHQPVGLAGLFARVIAGESGGNPRAINLYDSNAKAGHPSVGLAQVIRGTFDAFAGPFRNTGPFLAGVSINPLANIFAGLNYGIQTYGSVANIPGIASELHGGGYRPYHAGGPINGIKPGASGEWVKALAIQARMPHGAFHTGRWNSSLTSLLSHDWPNSEPHALPALAKYDPLVKRLVAYLWGRHGKKTTFDDALAHFDHGSKPIPFLDLMRAYDAGKGYILQSKGKGKGRHRFIPDSVTVPFRSGLRRYESMYHHDVQALEHKLKYKPENGTWGSGLNSAVKHVIAHALGKKHDDFLSRPWSPLTPVEKALQTQLKTNKDTAELKRDLDLFAKWGLIDLEHTLAGEDVGTALPIARSARAHIPLAKRLNAAYKVADTSTLGGHFVNQGFLSGGKGYAGFANGGKPGAGWAWVGERGPELVKFRGTEQVFPAKESAQMAGGGCTHGHAPLIANATFTDNTDVEIQLRKMAFIEQNLGLAR